MKKTLLLALATTLILANVSFADSSKDSIVTLDATATKEVTPDTATIRFYVENAGLNVAEIKEKNDKIVNSAITNIKAKLTEKESIKTISMSVNSVYSYKDKIRIFQKYEVKNGFEVKLKDISKVSQIIKIAMDSGVKSVGGLNMTYENTDATCNELMVQATKIAQSRAKLVAQAAGTDILKVKNINPYCSNNSNSVRPRFYATNAMSKAESMDSAPVIDSIEAGTINIRANVNASYYLK